MVTSSSDLDEHIIYLKDRVKSLTTLHYQFLLLGAAPEQSISLALQVIGRQDSTASYNLRKAVEELPYIEERLGCTSHYFVHFRHGEDQIQNVGELSLPILKMTTMHDRSYCAVAGRHGFNEPKELADLRACEVQRHMRSKLPADAVVEVETHRCDLMCKKLSEYPSLAHVAEVFIAAKWHHVQVSWIERAAQSTARAVESYEAKRQRLGKSDANPSLGSNARFKHNNPAEAARRSADCLSYLFVFG